VTAISLDKEKVTLEGIGTILQINASISPSNATNQSISWKSLDTSVATVDRGYIKSVAVGTTMIEAISEDGKKVARCEVTVTQAASTGTGIPTTPPTGGTSTPTTTPPTGGTSTPATPAKIVATGVSLDKTTLQLKPSGTQATLVATVSPGNAENKGVRWTSSNTAVATVTQDGQVTPLTKGSTTITVTTEDGGHSAQCAVTVSGVAPTGVSLDITALTLTTADNPVVLEATVLPADAENTSVTWSSTHPLVAHVDQTGKVTPVAKGTTTIKAATVAGNLIAECTVNVTAVVPQGITLDRDSLKLFLGGTPVTLTPTVLPSAAENKAVQWSSSKPSVATVDSAGKVTAVAEGTATITARTIAGDASTECEVTVVKLVLVLPPIVIGPVKVTGVSLDRTRLDLVTGGNTYSLVSTIAPGNATNKRITWTSSNTSVATVDQNGKVTPVAKGNATVTATTEDGGFKALCPVEVGTPNTTGNTVGNYASHGVIAFQGNWIYYTITGGKGLYKIRTDGSEHTQLSSDTEVGSIGVIGDWIFYSSNRALYRIRTDGTQRTLLNNLDSLWFPQVIGSTIYYLSNGSIYRISTSGENRVKVSDEYYINGMLVMGDQIYYTKSPVPHPTSNTGIYRMALNGSGTTRIVSGDIFYFFGNRETQTIVYGVDEEFFDSSYWKVKLYSVRADGSNKKLLGNDYYGNINLTANEIFYKYQGAPQNVNNGVYRMSTDGTLPMRISTITDAWGCGAVYGDHLYLVSADGLYRVKKDGTGEIRLK
jgi:uncharacterized protein YjdB